MTLGGYFGKHKLTEKQIKDIARYILFLHSENKYEWKYIDLTNPLMRFSFKDIILSVITLGKHYQNKLNEREKEYVVNYKNTVLKHKFYADFVVFEKIILEIKTVDCFNNSHYNQCLNYLKIAKFELAILANFNLISLEYKRIVQSKY